MMDRKKLLLLYNPSAGRAQTSRNLDMLLQKFCTGGCETTVYPILDGLNAEDILAGAESAGYDIVVCCGGDGTLHHTVNGLLRLEQPPLLGYIPSGSTNDFAASLGLPKTPEDAADAVVNGRPHAIDAGDFGGELFCYVAAFGAFSAVSYETPQNTLDDGEFEVLLIKAPTSVAEANTIVSKLLARDFNNELIHLLHADSVTVHFPTPTKWTLDGEYGGEHTDVSVQVLANALHMVF